MLFLFVLWQTMLRLDDFDNKFMRLLLTPVLLLYVVVGMLACSDPGEDAAVVSSPTVTAHRTSPLEMER